MKTKRVQKMISFPAGMYSVLEERSRKRGMLVPEYVRHVVLNEIDEDFDDIPLVSKKTEREMGESMKDYNNGDYVTVNTRAEIEDALKIE